MCKPLRKVKKTVTTLTFLMLVIFLLPIAASAADTGDEKIISDDFAVEISDETSKILESMGIENIDYDSLISASPRKIITCIIDIAKGKLKEPVKTLGIVLSIAVVAAVVGSFAPSKNRRKIFGRYGMLFSDSFCFDGASCEHPFVCGVVDCADG